MAGSSSTLLITKTPSSTVRVPPRRRHVTSVSISARHVMVFASTATLVLAARELTSYPVGRGTTLVKSPSTPTRLLVAVSNLLAALALETMASSSAGADSARFSGNAVREGSSFSLRRWEFLLSDDFLWWSLVLLL